MKETDRIIAGTMGQVLRPFDKHGMVGYEAELKQSEGKPGKNRFWQGFTHNEGGTLAENKSWDHKLNSKGTRIPKT